MSTIRNSGKPILRGDRMEGIEQHQVLGRPSGRGRSIKNAALRGKSEDQKGTCHSTQERTGVCRPLPAKERVKEKKEIKPHCL